MNLQPVCLPKSSHCQHSKYHIAPLFTLSYMFNDFNSTECTSKLCLKIVPPKQCRLNTLCHSELSLKFDPIASRAGHHKVLLSRFTCPILKIFGCPRTLLKVAFLSYPTTLCSAIPTLMPLHQYNQETYLQDVPRNS